MANAFAGALNQNPGGLAETFGNLPGLGAFSCFREKSENLQGFKQMKTTNDTAIEHSEISAKPDSRDQIRAKKVAYIMSRFPKLTETFILYEMIALENGGVSVELFPLLKENQEVHHKEVARLMKKAHFHRFFSLPIFMANVHFLLHKPLVYLRTIFEVLSGTFGSKNFFFGAIGIIPKSVRFAYEMQNLGVEHVHAHFCNHPAVAAFIISKLTGIPFTFTAHGSDLHKDQRMLDKKVAAAATAVTISDYNKEVMVKKCGEAMRNKIKVIHCGIDPALFECHDRSGRTGAFQILCVASYEAVKGHKFLVEACGILAKRGVDFTCHLVGYGPLRAQVEAQIAALGLTKQFVIHGGLPRSEVIKLLEKADVFVLPSVPTPDGKREGIPVVLMEAMSSCLPVISSRLSGIPELVKDGENGFLTEPGDVTAIANALLRFAGNASLRGELGRRGREFIIKEFNLQKNSRQLFHLFNKKRPED